MEKLRALYDQLRSGKRVPDKTFEDFAVSMKDSGKLEKVFAYLKSTKATTDTDLNSFKTNIGLTDPKTETPARNLPKDVVLKYTEHVRNQNITPLVNVEESDPLMYDKQKFTDFYRQKAVTKLSPADQQFYNDSLPENRDSFLALRGGLPDFEQYQKVVRAHEQGSRTPTDWPNIDFKKPGNQNVTVYKGIKGK